MRYLILAVVVGAGAGCATPSTYPERWDMGTYWVVIASPEQVSAHYHKNGYTGTHDSGKPVLPDEEIRAYTDVSHAKPIVFVSRKWRRCARHEACHALKLMSDEDCARFEPCLGEVGG